MRDTEIWKKPWFRKLPPEYKCLWDYILSNCNHAGIWDVDIELASFQIGCELKKDSAIMYLREHIHIIDNEKKWFIKDFIKFQYGELKENNKPHISVINILKEYDLIPTLRGIDTPSEGVKDKDKDKVKDKDNIKETEILNSETWIEEIGMLYKLSKDQVIDKLKTFLKELQLKDDFSKPIKDIKSHFVNYIRGKTEYKSEFPNYWSKKYQDSIPSEKWSSYWKHLRNLGLKPVKKNGEVIEWNRP